MPKGRGRTGVGGRAASALRKKYGPGAAMAWGPLACTIPLDPDPKLAVVTSREVSLCGAKRAGSYRGWGARGIGPQKPGRRRATTPPPMTVATKRAAAMQGPLKQCVQVIPEIWCPKTPLEMPGVTPRRGPSSRPVEVDVRRLGGRELALTHGQKGAC